MYLWYFIVIETATTIITNANKFLALFVCFSIIFTYDLVVCFVYVYRENNTISCSAHGFRVIWRLTRKVVKTFIQEELHLLKSNRGWVCSESERIIFNREKLMEITTKRVRERMKLDLLKLWQLYLSVDYSVLYWKLFFCYFRLLRGEKVANPNFKLIISIEMDYCAAVVDIAKTNAIAKRNPLTITTFYQIKFCI